LTDVHSRAMDSVLARVRTRETTPARFLRIAVLAAASVLVVVTTGAVVRLTASGLGCDNWPRCGSTPFPEKGGHAFVEFGNRVIAFASIVVTLLSWLAARRVRGLPSWVRKVALAVWLGMVAQIPLGGVTVIFDLHPLLVMSHFLLALVVLGGAVVVAVEAWSLDAGRAGPVGPMWWRVLALLGIPVGLALVVTGAVVSASGPHSGGRDIRRLGIGIVDAVYVHVRVAAVFGIGLLVIASWLLRHRRDAPGVAVLAGVLLTLVVAQAVLGEVQYRNHLPWGLVLLHVLLAATIWSTTVALAHTIWRPPAPLASAAAPPE
jgi:cytochrome c oxidase assembly protein subunit 15